MGSRVANATMSYGSTYIGDWNGEGALKINFSRTSQYAATQIYGSYYTPTISCPSSIASLSTAGYWSSYASMPSPYIVNGTGLNSNYSKQYLLVLGSSNTGTGGSWGMKYCAITATPIPDASLWSLNFESGHIGSTYRASYGSVKLGYNTIDNLLSNPLYPPQ